jgi:hypothetical protein
MLRSNHYHTTAQHTIQRAISATHSDAHARTNPNSFNPRPIYPTTPPHPTPPHPPHYRAPHTYCTTLDTRTHSLSHQHAYALALIPHHTIRQTHHIPHAHTRNATPTPPHHTPTYTYTDTPPTPPQSTTINTIHSRQQARTHARTCMHACTPPLPTPQHPHATPRHAAPPRSACTQNIRTEYTYTHQNTHPPHHLPTPTSYTNPTQHTANKTQTSMPVCAHINSQAHIYKSTKPHKHACTHRCAHARSQSSPLILSVTF